MKFSLDKSYEILERTPTVFRALLTGLNGDWIMNNEGPETFSPYDVVGHLIHAEKTDWRDRTIMILEHGTAKSFVPFDRFAQFEESKGKSLTMLLDEFEKLRAPISHGLSLYNLLKAILINKDLIPRWDRLPCGNCYLHGSFTT